MNNPFAEISATLHEIKSEVAALRATMPTTQPVNPDEEKPLNVEQAADFLGVAPQTVYQNIKRIPHRKRFGKLYFFRSELIAFLEGGAN